MDMHFLSGVSVWLHFTMTTSSTHSKKDRASTVGIASYTIGFAISLVLTLLSFLVAPFVGILAAPMIVILAIVQLFVQLLFFLHLGSERGGHLTIVLLGFAAGIIGILIIGTLWIMSNLSHLHRSTPTTQDIYQGGVVAPQNELH